MRDSGIGVIPEDRLRKSGGDFDIQENRSWGYSVINRFLMGL
jgi:hypothetical protein